MMRKSDERAVETVGGRELMRRAGAAVFRRVSWRGKAAIVCGGGNNAGDGYVLALLLAEAGLPCRLFLLEDRFSADGRYYFDQCLALGVETERCGPETDLRGYGVIVDCIYGTGFRGAVSGLAADMIRKINAADAYTVSVDINSGLGGDSGMSALCVRADLTVSIGDFKPGHFLNMAKDVIRRLENADIGIAPVGEPYRMPERLDFQRFLAPRPHFSNKGDYGYVTLIGGCAEYPGAAKLAALGCAALRAGCGVATLAAPACLGHAMAAVLLEGTFKPLPERDGFMRFAPRELDDALSRSAAACIGMGWGRGPDNKAILSHLLERYDRPLVVDADGLNTLAELEPAQLRSARAKLLLTPHIKEFSRLSGLDKSEILADPCAHAKAYARQTGALVLLKGPASVVTDGECVYLVDRGCPGMATAGSGDVLTGVLTGLLGWAEFGPMAAALGAYVNGLAGELAQARQGAVAMTASDTAGMLPRAWRSLSEQENNRNIGEQYDEV